MISVANCFKLFVKLLNFKGNSDIERYQMANKKIPFKYTRPVEDWLQEKGKLFTKLLEWFLFVWFSCHSIGLLPFNLWMNNQPLNPFKNK